MVTDAQTEFGEKSVMDDSQPCVSQKTRRHHTALHSPFVVCLPRPHRSAPGSSKRLSLGAAEAIIRLCCRASFGSLGAVLRQALVEHAQFTWPRLLVLIFDDKYPFRLRAQLAHLLRIMHVSPQLVSPSPSMVCGLAWLVPWLPARPRSPFSCCQVGAPSFTASTMAGSASGAASSAAAASADSTARGVPVSIPNMDDEVAWGLGRTGKAVCREPSQGLSWLGFNSASDSASDGLPFAAAGDDGDDGDAVVAPPAGGLALHPSPPDTGADESKAPDGGRPAAHSDAFPNAPGDVPMLTEAEVQTAGDCEAPMIGVCVCGFFLCVFLCVCVCVCLVFGFASCCG